jgi:hypothetical protein
MTRALDIAPVAVTTSIFPARGSPRVARVEDVFGIVDSVPLPLRRQSAQRPARAPGLRVHSAATCATCVRSWNGVLGSPG